MSAPINIALIEDHEALRATTEIVLIQQGYRVFAMACAEDIDEVVGGEPIDIFIVDLNLPGEDGLSLSLRLREAQPNAGIIMVTARSSSEDIEHGFDAGADIYLVKPVTTAALIASLKSFSRRLKLTTPNEPRFSLDSNAHVLSGPSGDTHLSPVEQAILISLVRGSGDQLETFQLLALVGQTEENFNKASLEIRITRLRKKLISIGAGTRCIQSIRMVGYQLSMPIQIDR
jgi:DNA-binding response OmpR family regulator